MGWIDLTDTLTVEGRKKLKVGQVLFFDKVDIRIARKYKGKVWGKRVFMYQPDEVDIIDKK